MLDISWLNTFVTLADYKHFGKAAVALHMTQPNVSLHLKQLEQATRLKLIERNPFCLTPAGLRLLKSSKNVLMEMQVCQADLNDFNEFNTGTLKIAASDTISRFILIEAFEQFKTHYPGIDITLLNTTSSQAYDLVKGAEADLGFVISQKKTAPLHYTELQQIEWCALGNGLNDDLNDSLSEKQLEQKTKHNQLTLILLGHDTRTREFIDKTLPLLNLPEHRIMEVGSVDAQIDWAEAGFGVAIIPRFAISNKASLNTNVTPLQLPTTSLGYIVRQNQVLSKPTKQLLAWVSEAMIKLKNQ